MAAGVPASIGRINAANAEDALFLKVFGSEVIAAYEQASVTEGADMVRSISSGKSATFPVIGRTAAAYHVPGAEIVGTDINHNERVITINDLLVSSAFLSNFEEAKNHYDLRSIYSTELGRALAFQKDKHILQTIGLASLGGAGATGLDAGTTVTNTGIASSTAATAANAVIQALFDAASALDSHYVPKEGRKAFIRLEEYYKLANATNAVNVDFTQGNGGIDSGKVMRIAGIELVPTPHFVSSNVTAFPAKGSATQGGSAPQTVNLSNYVCLVTGTGAGASVGTVKLMDLAVESEYDIRRQGTLMAAKYAMGHGIVRAESAIGIKEA